MEAAIDQRKNISQIELFLHHSDTSFLVNLVFGLIVYTYQPKKHLWGGIQ